MLHTVLFYMFAVCMLSGAAGVVFSRNPVHSVMYLVFTFFQSALLWLMAEAEFLAIVLVLVYVGAVMVLFLFIVMMLDVNVEAAKRSLARYAWVGIAISLLMAIELIQLIWLKSSEIINSGNFSVLPENYSNTKALGAVLYTEHFYAFEIAAVILLLAIIAAITLTMRRRPGLKVQDIAAQVAVRSKDRIRIIKMKTEKNNDRP